MLKESVSADVESIRILCLQAMVAKQRLYTRSPSNHHRTLWQRLVLIAVFIWTFDCAWTTIILLTMLHRQLGCSPDWKILSLTTFLVVSLWASKLVHFLHQIRHVHVLPSRLICYMGAQSQGFGHCNSPRNCTGKQTYQCADGTCIPLSKYRNSIFDCKDQSDEDVNCCNGFFKCDTMLNGIGKCLANDFIDDGTIQCIDGSDETVTNDKTCSILTSLAFENSVPVDDYMYKCKTHKYGSRNPKCIKKIWCLDGKFNCPLGDDEDASLFDRCKVGKFPCGQNADCTNRGNGTVSCVCKAGFSGDGHFCTNISLTR